MLFNTLAFAKFFFVVFVVAWGLSRWPRARFWFLAVASYFFYAGLDVLSVSFVDAVRTTNPWQALVTHAPHLKFVPIIFIGSTVDYVLALWIGRHSEERARKRALYVTIAMNAGLLLVFKYWDFLADQVIALGGPDGRLGLPLPIGISFFTFMSLSYVVDVYRREIPPSTNYAHYVTYIAFFPHLVAGPIIRGKDLLPLFERQPVLTATAAGEGIFLVVSGLLKKVVISDYLAINLVDRVVAEPTSYSSVEVLVAMFGYAIQIYCDFSGYSDVAIGVALLLGYRLKINFDAPFKASNLVEFWRRWHISLSSWLRDYIYIPLGGSRGSRPSTPRRRALSFAATALGAALTAASTAVGVLDADPAHGSRNMLLFLGSSALMLWGLSLAEHGKKYVNVWITMVVCGIWHGAAWSFVLFGVVHGLAVGATHLFFDAQGKRPSDGGDGGLDPRRFAAVAVTFVFTTFTFVLIRAPLDKALLMFRQLTHLTTFTPNLTRPIVAVILGALVMQWLPKGLVLRLRDRFIRAPAVAQAVMLFGVALVLRLASSSEAVPFVYGQF